MRPTIHLVALPHTQVSAEHCGCAYTAKALKFCRMMGRRGHDVQLYAPEGPEVEGAELVACLTESERVQIFGPDDPTRLPDWPTDAQFALFNERASAALAERLQPHDLTLLTAGRSQLSVARALPSSVLAVEPGVGYEGVFTDYCAFESWAWRHHVYALQRWDGRNYDATIPNYFDPDDFPYLNEGAGDYLLFVGRLVWRKGPQVAAAIAERLGMRLLVAGAGATEWREGRIVAPEVVIEAPGVEYVGPVSVDERARLMAGATALLAPTLYVGPFEGVAVEAMLCGTPALTTDFGAFTETVQEGVSGYRFRTLAEGCAAVERARSLRPEDVRQYALERYSLEAVAPQFERWFDQLATLWGEGWYA